MAGELFKQMTGVRAEHIPYKGSGPAMQDLVGGVYHYNFAGMQAAQTLVRGGKLRGIAVTNPRRVPAMPEIPAMAEAVPGFEVVGWYGVIGPANLPAPIVTRLHDELVRILKQPDVHERIVSDGSLPVGNSPEEFRKFMHADLAKWAKVVKESGAKLD
jgi:tripartite-type tricarboxylate transporter receptor subunit TctC